MRRHVGAGIVLLCACIAAPGPSALENGIYRVIREAPTPQAARASDDSLTVLAYDGRYLSEPEERTRYLALSPDSYVPLILEGPPDSIQDARGLRSLGLTLAGEHASKLEEFSREHLGGQVAIVIDGEPITTHKVRAVITGGKLMITRCTDNGCEVLFTKLTGGKESE